MGGGPLFLLGNRHNPQWVLRFSVPSPFRLIRQSAARNEKGPTTSVVDPFIASNLVAYGTMGPGAISFCRYGTPSVSHFGAGAPFK